MQKSSALLSKEMFGLIAGLVKYVDETDKLKNTQDVRNELDTSDSERGGESS